MAKQRLIRRYVDVIARWDDDGRIEPLAICWRDGRSFQIDAVLGEPAASAAPDAARRVLRYRVVIGEHETNLFLETEGGSRWFVEFVPGSNPWRFGTR